MRKLSSFLVATVIIAAVPVIGLATATAAYAATGTGCEGNGVPTLGIPGCSGLDPAKSYNSSNGQECSGGASTVVRESILGGVLELRWGPNCQTNWARFTPGNNDDYQMFVDNIYTGVIAGNGLQNVFTWSGRAGVAAYGDQVYAPDPDPAQACVRDITGEPSSLWQCITQ